MTNMKTGRRQSGSSAPYVVLAVEVLEQRIVLDANSDAATNLADTQSLQAAEVQTLLERAAAASNSQDAIIAIVDRQGHILACQHSAQEEAQPDALPVALYAHQVHSVVPVSGADQRQTVTTELQPVSDSPDAVLVKAFHLAGAARQVIVGVILGIDRPTLQEGRIVPTCQYRGRRHWQTLLRLSYQIHPGNHLFQ